MGNPVTALRGLAFWVAKYRGNGLDDATWVPVLGVDGRIVGPLLGEMRRAGIATHCTRLSRGWRPPPHHSEWCVWVGYSSYWKGQERLAEIIPLLISRARQHGRGLIVP